ncbi:hypothetical protein [Pantoea agglomerans]|uniref:hypothetical protein n=1 Tax=Enterobacter agglomerans TaxID=549 RepID=UPI003BF5F5C0
MRLNTLEHVVDRFVIVESRYTFTGKRREKLHFDIEKFDRFRDKIIYIVNEIAPRFYQEAFKSNSSVVNAGETDPWENEATARNQIMQGWPVRRMMILLLCQTSMKFPDPRR